MIRKIQILVLASIVATLVIWPDLAVPATVPEIDPDKGLVIFYRPKKFSGGAVRFNINHAQGSLGILNSGTMVYRYFEPGPQQFWSQVISQDAIMVDVKAGGVYFVKGEAKMGALAGRPKFKQVDEVTGRAEVGKL
jgi:hypothetical protein